jgi:protein-L-isoaspartate(D-aspartate) O-methyltransferase
MEDSGPGSFADSAGVEWREALAAAPRELFVPDVAWTRNDGLIDRQAAPETWRAAVDRDDAIVTQVADGEVELSAENMERNPHKISSSCSAPFMVFDFQRLLDPYPGDHVLEIGTGTGWTAALLAAKLGAENVISIEIDEQVAKQAAANLENAGFAPHLVVGDGTLGHPPGAPYDRVHVTCGMRDIPYAWVEQTRPGGIIACPWMPPSGAGRITRLTTNCGARCRTICAVGSTLRR